MLLPLTLNNHDSKQKQVEGHRPQTLFSFNKDCLSIIVGKKAC